MNFQQLSEEIFFLRFCSFFFNTQNRLVSIPNIFTKHSKGFIRPKLKCFPSFSNLFNLISIILHFVSTQRKLNCEWSSYFNRKSLNTTVVGNILLKTESHWKWNKQRYSHSRPTSPSLDFLLPLSRAFLKLDLSTPNCLIFEKYRFWTALTASIDLEAIFWY